MILRKFGYLTNPRRVFTRSGSFASGIEAFARSDPAHAVTQSQWDADPMLLGVEGGIVDLRTGKVLPAEPKEHITKQAGAAPSEAQDCPAWLAFLDQATGGDAEMILFLQTWAGYCLTGDTREHALAFVYGPGGTGKSVFLSTVAGVMGDYAVTAAMETFAASRTDRHATELAMLRGARMVSATETEEGRAWAEARIKQLTGGDAISARFMRQDFFTFTPQFKLLIVGNHAPALRNVDDAMRRRFNVIPFNHKPANPDRELESKLRAEWAGILRWAINGCLTWQLIGLCQPESVRHATEEYFNAQDTLAQWLADRCIVEPANHALWSETSSLFADWSAFAMAANERAGTRKSFAARLARLGLNAGQKKADGRKLRIWTGVRLLPSESEPDFEFADMDNHGTSTWELN